MQIGLVLLGKWKKSKRALEYLILLLNLKQNIFEYQLVTIEGETEKKLLAQMEGAQAEHELLKCMLHAKRITAATEELSEMLQNVSSDLVSQLTKESLNFDTSQLPRHFIYICTSEHSEEFFFQHDGVNGFHPEDPYHGALILVGNQNHELFPPTIIEYVYKFILRICLRWKHTTFTNSRRHYCQKACLFDYVKDLSLVRHLVLHNYICHSCKEIIGEEETKAVLKCLDTSNIYSESIDRHPAKTSSQLGYNLSLTRGIYKTKKEIFKEKFKTAFVEKSGSTVAVISLIALAAIVGLEAYVPRGD